MDAHYGGAIPLDLLRSEQEAISSQLGTIADQLSRADVGFSTIQENLAIALDLAENGYAAYLRAPARPSAVQPSLLRSDLSPRRRRS